MAYEDVLASLKNSFEEMAANWSDLSAHLKTTQAKGITLEDWNSLIQLLECTDAYVRATYYLISNLGSLGTSLKEDIDDKLEYMDDRTFTDVDLDARNRIVFTRADGQTVTTHKSVPAGPEGPRGPAGVVYFPNIDPTTGRISWSVQSYSGQVPSSALIKGPKGDKGDKGDTGAPFLVSKVFTSVTAMQAGAASDGVAVGQFVTIDAGVESEDTAKIYRKDRNAYNGYTYITDLSGKEGIQGPKGDKGDKGDQGYRGIKGDEGDVIVPSISEDGTLTWALYAYNAAKPLPEAFNIKGPRGEQGYAGVDGADGVTPHIGENGNWWLGNNDTGVAAQGPQGEQGPQGVQGPAGDSVGGTGAASSALESLSWDSESDEYNTYCFKAFEINRDSSSLYGLAAFRFGVYSIDEGKMTHVRVVCDVSSPHKDEDESTPEIRLTIVPQRIYFEDSACKNWFTNCRIFVAEGSNPETFEVWFAVLTPSNRYEVHEAALNVIPLSDGFSEMQLVQKTYAECPTNVPSNLSLSFKPESWANKAAVLNISSRATAPNATASGDGCWANAYAADAGGIGVEVNGEGSFARGKNIIDSGKYDGVFGLSHELGETSQMNLVSGYNHAVDGTSWLVSGNNNVVPEGIKQGGLIGANLIAAANRQVVLGEWNERDEYTDTGAKLIVANGISTRPVNIATVRKTYKGTAGNYYAIASKPSDLLTLGYFNSIKTDLMDEILAYVENAEQLEQLEQLEVSTDPNEFYVTNHNSVTVNARFTVDGEYVRSESLGPNDTTSAIVYTDLTGHKSGTHQTYTISVIAEAAGYRRSAPETFWVELDEYGDGSNNGRGEAP